MVKWQLQRIVDYRATSNSEHSIAYKLLFIVLHRKLSFISNTHVLSRSSRKPKGWTSLAQ
jgi:hypothetical protein